PPIRPVAGEEEIAAIRREAQAQEHVVKDFRLQAAGRIGGALLARVKRFTLTRGLADEDATAHRWRVGRIGGVDVRSVSLLPYHLLPLPLRRIVYVDQGHGVADILADDGDDRPRAGPARRGEELEVRNLERAAMVSGPVINDRHLPGIAEAVDHELMSVR